MALNAATIDHLQVDLAGRSYDIKIGPGLIADADKWLADCLGKGGVFIITDENVAGYYLAPIEAAVTRLGHRQHSIVLPAGEASKSFENWRDVSERLLSLGAERGSTIIALGGGVIGDLAGFIAATLLRGIDFVQIPTTLLAQVDSSVGGKTAINSAHGKNLIGAFYQPKRVLIDSAALDSLPRRELLAGYAETVKYGLIGDPEFFDWLEINAGDLIAGDERARRHAILTSCAAKAATVRADEREHGQRALLNFGHTFAHAFEAEAGYASGLLHGEAVAVGMIMALELSRQTGMCSGQDVERVRQHFQAVGLPICLADLPGAQDWDPHRLYHHMHSDKKVAAGRINFVAATAIGAAVLSNQFQAAQVLQVLTDH